LTASSSFVRPDARSRLGQRLVGPPLLRQALDQGFARAAKRVDQKTSDHVGAQYETVHLFEIHPPSSLRQAAALDAWLILTQESRRKSQI
jgi:hypothetical protein